MQSDTERLPPAAAGVAGEAAPPGPSRQAVTAAAAASGADAADSGALVDGGAALGGSFRIGWGPAHALWHAGRDTLPFDSHESMILFFCKNIP